MTQLAEARTTGSFGMLLDVIAAGNTLVLSGAGLSTESGIPDYRGPTGLARRATPMTYQTFTASADARRRYWARSHLGWRHIGQAVPNRGHHAVAELGRRGLLAGIITQNVDGLHQAAGASEVTELHGSLHRVVCLSCGQRTARTDLHRRLAAANPGWDAESTALINPDGDAVLVDDATESFRVVDCAFVSRRAQAGRGVLRRERAPAARGGLLRHGRAGQFAGGPGVLADRDVGLSVRAARGEGPGAGGDRQPGPYPGRRVRGRDAGCSPGPGAHRAGGRDRRCP